MTVAGRQVCSCSLPHTRRRRRLRGGCGDRDTRSLHCPTTGQLHAGNCVAVGTMSAAFAPLSRLIAAVVLDAHDEAYHAEAAPTWCAWEVVAERARRDGAPLTLVSPCPTLDVLSAGRLVMTDRTTERRAWPLVEAVDRRDDDPHTGLFSERVVRLVRWAAEEVGDRVEDRQHERRVICVLNRTGRARLLSCAACKTLAAL